MYASVLQVLRYTKTIHHDNHFSNMKLLSRSLVTVCSIKKWCIQRSKILWQNFLHHLTKPLLSQAPWRNLVCCCTGNKYPWNSIVPLKVWGYILPFYSEKAVLKSLCRPQVQSRSCHTSWPCHPTHPARRTAKRDRCRSKWQRLS